MFHIQVTLMKANDELHVGWLKATDEQDAPLSVFTQAEAVAFIAMQLKRPELRRVQLVPIDSNRPNEITDTSLVGLVVRFTGNCVWCGLPMGDGPPIQLEGTEGVIRSVYQDPSYRGGPMYTISTSQGLLVEAHAGHFMLPGDRIKDKSEAKRERKGKGAGVSDEKSRRRFNCFARHGCTDFWIASYAMCTITQLVMDLQERKNNPLNATMHDKLLLVIADLNRELNSL